MIVRPGVLAVVHVAAAALEALLQGCGVPPGLDHEDVHVPLLREPLGDHRGADPPTDDDDVGLLDAAPHERASGSADDPSRLRHVRGETRRP